MMRRVMSGVNPQGVEELVARRRSAGVTGHACATPGLAAGA